METKAIGEVTERKRVSSSRKQFIEITRLGSPQAIDIRQRKQELDLKMKIFATKGFNELLCRATMARIIGQETPSGWKLARGYIGISRICDRSNVLQIKIFRFHGHN
jgi:hypothetical protein